MTLFNTCLVIAASVAVVAVFDNFRMRRERMLVEPAWRTDWLSLIIAVFLPALVMYLSPLRHSFFAQSRVVMEHEVPLSHEPRIAPQAIEQDGVRLVLTDADTLRGNVSGALRASADTLPKGYYKLIPGLPGELVQQITDTVTNANVPFLVADQSCVLVGLAAPEAALRVTLKRGPHILYMGDSITDGGWGRSGGDDRPSEKRDNWDQNHLYGHSYMMLCASELQCLYQKLDLQCFNRGISGNTLDDLARRWGKDCLDLHPDVLSLLVGTNDVDRLYWPDNKASLDYEAWEAQYRSLLDTALQMNPELRLVLCTPFVAKVGWRGADKTFADRQQHIDQLAVIVRNIAGDYHATLVDFNSLFKCLYAAKPPRQDYWIWDAIHPTPAGHHQMSTLWLSSTRQLF